MMYMQLAATEMGIGNCWVQCRGRVSQQKKGEPIATTSEDIALVKHGAMQKMESLVAATIAKDKALIDNMETDEFLRGLLGIPEQYSVEALLSLGMPPFAFFDDCKKRPTEFEIFLELQQRNIDIFYRYVMKILFLSKS